MPNKNVNDSINAKMPLAGAVTSSLPLYYSIIIRNTDQRPRVSQFWTNCAHLDARSKSGTAFGSAALGTRGRRSRRTRFRLVTCYITATRHESWKQRLSHSCGFRGFRGTPTVNRILCSAGQKPDFRRRSPHTVTLNLFGVDLLPNIYTGMRGRNAYSTATIPTFEDASWTRHLLPYWRGQSGISRLSPRVLRAWVRGYS